MITGLPKILGVLLFVFGSFFSGFYLGNNRGTTITELKHKTRSVEEIKTELKNRESEIITSYIVGEGRIDRVNEGGFFNPRYVSYFKATLTNTSTLAVAKDIQLNIDYLSKTGSKIGSQKVTVYEFIKPSQSIKVKEAVSVPDNMESIRFQITDVKSE